MEKYVGVIDLGSNSARLVIYYLRDDGLAYEIDNYKNVLRLSANIGADVYIDSDGINRTVDAIKKFKALCNIKGVDEIIGVATAAVRQAKNGEELLKQIEKETEIKFRLLSGKEEARFGYLAVINSMNIASGVSIDIGGGSTEITIFENREIVFSTSLPFGAVTLTKMFFKSEVPMLKEIAKLRSFLYKQFNINKLLKDVDYPIIAIGGTARNLAKIHQRAKQYPLTTIHSYSIEYNDVVEVNKWLIELPFEIRKNVKGLSKDRADIIIAGIFILQTLLEYTGATKLIFSSKGLRDGIIYEKIMEGGYLPKQKEVATLYAEQLAIRYNANLVHAKHVAYIATTLYDELGRLGIIKPTDVDINRKILVAASLLHDIGRSINIYNSANHTFYLLTNTALIGFSHRESIIVAFIASYKSNKILNEKLAAYKELILPEDEALIKELGAILLFSRALDRSMSQIVREITINKNGKNILISCLGSNELVEYEAAKNLMSKLSRLFKCNFSLRFIQIQ